jgi:hypothetical protein
MTMFVHCYLHGGVALENLVQSLCHHHWWCSCCCECLVSSAGSLFFLSSSFIVFRLCAFLMSRVISRHYVVAGVNGIFFILIYSLYKKINKRSINTNRFLRFPATTKANSRRPTLASPRHTSEKMSSLRHCQTQESTIAKYLVLA